MEEVKNYENKNQIEIYAPEEAEEIRKEKRKICEEIASLNNDSFETHKICLRIHEECFGDIAQEEITKHIFYHILSGSNGLENFKENFIFDERDKKAEKMLKEELEKLELKN